MVGTASMMIQHKFMFKILAFGVGIGVIFSVFMFNREESAIYVTTSLVELSNNRTQVILLWNSFFESRDYDFGLGNDAFSDNNCEYSNCYITDNRSHLPPRKYDAIVFHGPKVENIPAGVSRSPRQRYVFFSLESPYHVDTEQFYDNFYNWTISYRLDSDIPLPYGRIIKRELKKEEKEENEIDFGRKNKWAAWFVSNCNTEGGRENYVYVLRKYIPVHIYGTCGEYNCERILGNDTCYRMVENEYKFYLSFENSICDDYVTEKLFNVLKYNTIPVVFGGADYSKFMPPDSYINAMDYTPKELAKVMKRIGQNEEEYRKYMKWKKDFVVKLRNEKPASGKFGDHPFCELCKKLHTDRLAKTYTNFNGWWKDGRCKPAPTFSFSELHPNLQPTDLDFS